MDGWPAEFPLPPFSRAETPDLDIDSLLDFASQSLQPSFEQTGTLKTPTLSYNDDGLNMPFIALPIHRGYSFTGRKHDFPRDLPPAPPPQTRELSTRRNWAAVGEARSSSEEDKHDKPTPPSGGVDSGVHVLREKNRRAQRKFRERQKQRLAESEDKATELRRELEQLRIEKGRLETRNGLLEKLVSMKGGGALSMFSDLDTALEAEAAQAKEASQTVSLTVRKGAPQNISLDELKQLPYPKLTRLWKEYVDEMRAALDQAAGDEASPAGKRVISLIEELRMVLTCLMSANPLGMQSLRALKMDPDGAGSTMELPPPELHEKLLQDIGLRPKQRQAALAYRNLLLSRMGALLRQRRDISLQLLRTLGAPDKQAMARGTVLAQGQMAACRAAEDLRSNIRDEQELYNHFLMAVRSLLTPIQSAIAISHAWPWFPDALSLFNSVAKEEGAPGELELLACPTPDGLPGLPDLTAAPPASLLIVEHKAL